MGINASDINYSAGRYDPTVKPPFDCGFEVCIFINRSTFMNWNIQSGCLCQVQSNQIPMIFLNRLQVLFLRI